MSSSSSDKNDNNNNNNNNGGVGGDDNNNNNANANNSTTNSTLNSRFGGVIDLESQATMLLDTNGVITYLDRNIAKVFDYAAQELVGQKFVRLLASPFDVHYSQLLANVAASSNKGAAHHALLNYSTPSSRLVEAKTKRGEVFVVALYLSVVVERDVVVFVVAVERAKQPIGVLTACKGVVLSCNAECERIFGFGPGEMLGQRVASLVAATADLSRLRVDRPSAPGDDLALQTAGGTHNNGSANGNGNGNGSNVDDDEMTLYVDFLQPAQPRKRNLGDIASVNLVAGTPVSASYHSSWLGSVGTGGDEAIGRLVDEDELRADGVVVDENDDDDDAADDDDDESGNVNGDSITNVSSTALTQSFRAVELETECVDKVGRHFSARVHLQRKRMGVVELFRGFIQPIAGGDMAVLLITDADGHILLASQMYAKAMLGYLPVELCKMNINEVLTGLPVTSPSPRTPAAPTAADVDDAISVAAPGIKVARPQRPFDRQTMSALRGSNDSSSSSQLESVIRESGGGGALSDESETGSLVNSFSSVQVLEDGSDAESDDDGSRAASPHSEYLSANAAAKRARAQHGAAVFVRQQNDVSTNFALSVGRRTTARHKSGAQVALMMDVMRFQTRDNQVRFSVRLYSAVMVDEPAPVDTPSTPSSVRRSSSASVRRRSQSAAASEPVGSVPPTPPAAPVRQVPFLGDYMLSRELGRGSFATVRLGTHVQTGEQRAVKLFLLDHGTPEEIAQVRVRAFREVRVLERVRGHPNVVNLYEVLDGDAAGGGTALVLEYVAGGELFNEIVSRGGLGDDEARVLFVQLANAVAHCHSNGVAHRDLKHQNILTDGHGRVLLIDFGLAIAVDTCRDPADLQMGVGTPAYAAPEMLRATVTNPMASDIWSLGVVLYSMVCADFPFRNVAEVLNGQFQPSRAPRLSPLLADLLKHMLVSDANARMPIGDILQHPWLTAGVTPSN